jgi:hypothetical protein
VRCTSKTHRLASGIFFNIFITDMLLDCAGLLGMMHASKTHRMVSWLFFNIYVTNI